MRFTNGPSREEKELNEEKHNLITERNQISITEHFAKHSKVQRKINAIDEKLNDIRNEKSNISVQLAVIYGLKLAIGALVVLISIFFRNYPVFKIDEKISLVPFDYFISFPNEKNTVSFHFWYLCCATVARLIKL